MIYSSSELSPTQFRFRTILGVLRLWKALRKADVIHVFSDLQLHNRLEKKILHFFFLRLAKNKLKYITFLGSEVRNPDIEIAINPYYAEIRKNPKYEYLNTETVSNSHSIQQKYAELDFTAILNPEVIHYIDQSILRIAHFYNHPGNVENISKKTEQNQHVLKFVHAGTASLAKGTNEINNIMKEIIEEGYPVDYICIQGVSQNEFKQILGSADYYIDQMIWGWYGVAAIQAMALEIPVISYLGEEQLKSCPHTGIINSDLKQLKETIINLINQPELQSVYQQQIKTAYQTLHDPKVVVEKLVSNYLSDISNR